MTIEKMHVGSHSLDSQQQIRRPLAPSQPQRTAPCFRSNGRELEMGSSFDAFAPCSHHGDAAVSPEAQRNRHLLLGLMSAAGWNSYNSE